MKEFALAEVGAAHIKEFTLDFPLAQRSCANISESLYSKSGKNAKNAKSGKNAKNAKNAKSCKNVKYVKNAAGTKFALICWHEICLTFYAFRDLGSGMFFAYIKCK